MARHPRQLSGSGIYHVIVRGINKQRIFEEGADYQRFLGCMAEVGEKSGRALYAYTLMGNHVHILLKTNEEPLSLVMKRLSLKHSYWFNAKHGRSGHLFQNRYKSYPVEGEAYFVTALRCLYHNPVVAKTSRMPAAYRWGSRRLLGEKSSLIDEAALLQIVSLEAIEALGDGPGGEIEARAKRGPRPRFSDESVLGMMGKEHRADSASGFQGLGQKVQKELVLVLRDKKVSIRQIARVTGLSKGVVERWSRSC